jgi:hypothetical protein
MCYRHQIEIFSNETLFYTNKNKLCKKMLMILVLQYLGISYKDKNPDGMFKYFQLFLYLLMNINEIILFWSNH